ncbi:MAG: PKD domain-containing protein [Treponema sp.]|nr:PKD domain-containing protein [Treponema sp.]
MNKTLKKMALIAVMAAVIAAACTNEPDSPPGNKPPTANAGTNQNVALASNLTVTLNGAASADPDGSIASYAWECVGHTGIGAPYTTSQVTGMISNADKAIATVDLRKAGAYTFKLTVTDNEGAAATQNVTVNVAPIPKSITVPAITAVTNPMNFGTVASLTGWDTNFPAADVTYTLTLSQGGSTKVTVNSTSATSISASGQTNGIYTLTQTFYYKGIAMTNGSRSVGIEVMSQTFGEICVSESNYDE